MKLVRLLDIPVSEYVGLHRYVGDLVRELEIIQVGTRAGVSRPPEEVRDLIRDLLSSYAEAREAAWSQADGAAREGRGRLDMEVWLPIEAADAATSLAELFEHADELCRAGVLLTVPTPPELRRLREWTTAEVRRQLLEDAEPCPYPC